MSTETPEYNTSWCVSLLGFTHKVFHSVLMMYERNGSERGYPDWPFSSRFTGSQEVAISRPVISVCYEVFVLQGIWYRGAGTKGSTAIVRRKRNFYVLLYVLYEEYVMCMAANLPISTWSSTRLATKAPVLSTQIFMKVITGVNLSFLYVLVFSIIY
jgi:hypothetical protein